MARRIVAADDGRSRRFSLRSPSSGLTIIRDGATIACQTHLSANLARRSGRGRGGCWGSSCRRGCRVGAKGRAGKRVGGHGMRRVVLRRERAGWGMPCRVAPRRFALRQGWHPGRIVPRGCTRGVRGGRRAGEALCGACRAGSRRIVGRRIRGGAGYRARVASYRGAASGTAPAPGTAPRQRGASRPQTHAGRQPVRRRPACLRAPVRPR